MKAVGGKDVRKMIAIALIEDSPDSAEIVRIVLEDDAGISGVQWFVTAADFLQVFTPNAFGVILMDIGLPGRAGYEVLGDIRKIDGNVPIIAVTAYAFEDDRARALRAGFSEYVVKPI